MTSVALIRLLSELAACQCGSVPSTTERTACRLAVYEWINSPESRACWLLAAGLWLPLSSTARGSKASLEELQVAMVGDGKLSRRCRGGWAS